MNFDLTDDQRLLKDMVDRFATEKGGLDAHRAAKRSELGWSRDSWARMAELGFFALCLSEEHGGLGGGGTESMLVAQAFGHGLFAEPFLVNAIMAVPILAEAGDAARALLAGLIDGTQTTAILTGDIKIVDGRLSGAAKRVAVADSADQLLVAVQGCGLYLSNRTGQGVELDTYPIHGGGRAAHIRLNAVSAQKILEAEAADYALQRAEERRVAYLAAEALGTSELALELTVEYLKTRVQFGKPIGTNQALQHRAAEMCVEIEQLRSAAILAACILDCHDKGERSRVLTAVAMVTAKVGRFIAQQAVQLHGGMGVTEEHAVGHCFLRLTAIGLLLGETESNARRLAEHGGFVTAAPYWS